ncbi:uncharacterized protein LOC100198895 isoform X2 [Hydra vulgaris]|uniref:uncharacterized protein LOC100198895 isoform X2 n=1 Tax=Hydra vulgaris TaxID=6087 RepID=UPI001F5E90F4|nr:uncharacterized protein LOC100198895 isoform X2 [Hydra vulgaris]XP_047131951.1 uncharacterized protein LOC100198895 isoform X2 [Hydra vulgaris]
MNNIAYLFFRYWAACVVQENDTEWKTIVPCPWVDTLNQQIFWPLNESKSLDFYFKQHESPELTWVTYPIVEFLLHQGTREEAQELVDFATTAEDVSSSDDGNALPKKHTRTLSPVLEVKKSYNKKESSTNVNLDRKHFREENLPVFVSSSSFLSSSMQKIKYTNSKQDKDKKAAHPHTTHPALIVSPSSGGTNREELLETSPLSCSASKSRSSRKKFFITFADGGAGFKEMTNKQFQYVMLMKMEQLEDNQIQITNSLESLVDGGNSDASVVVEDMQPMLSIEEFDIEEIKLQNKTYRDKKKIAIKTLGGKDLRASVRLALDALMARNVQNLFSKDGISGKKAFSKTMHYRCLLGAFLDPTKKFTKDIIDFNV